MLILCCISVTIWSTYGQNIDFKIRRDNLKKSYEHHVYESVDDSSLSLAISQKPMKKELKQQRVNTNKQQKLVYDGWLVGTSVFCFPYRI